MPTQVEKRETLEGQLAKQALYLPKYGSIIHAKKVLDEEAVEGLSTIVLQIARKKWRKQRLVCPHCKLTNRG